MYETYIDANTDMKRFDLMHSINTRGTLLVVSKVCLPHLLKSKHGHILNISSPLLMAPHWFSNHVAYTMAKYGMSMCVLGMAEEFKDQGLAANALWPRTAIHTAAIDMIRDANGTQYSQSTEIMAYAAYAILSRDPKTCTGNFFIDEEVLIEEGFTDSKRYACFPENADKLHNDFFLLDKYTSKLLKKKLER